VIRLNTIDKKRSPLQLQNQQAIAIKRDIRDLQNIISKFLELLDFFEG
jgi:NurA-like 5'-3' nuclease